MKKIILLLLVLVVSIAKANDPNIFDDSPVKTENTNVYDDSPQKSEYSTTNSLPVPGDGGTGGTGTGEAVSIDMYQSGLLVLGLSLIIIKTTRGRKEK